MQNWFGKGKRLRYLCQDEMRVGLKTETGHVITARGVKPVAPVAWGRDHFWVYGVVEPHGGCHFEQAYDQLNSEPFQHFLDALSESLDEAIAVIQLDQAKAHQALAWRWSENLMPVFQPAQSPELNQQERFWQRVRMQLEGECFTTLTQLRTRLNKIFDALVPEQVASLTSDDFILEALFYAAL